jgi:hypothetical protein
MIIFNYFNKETKEMNNFGKPGCIPTWKTGKTGKSQGISKVREKPGKVREFCNWSGNFQFS